MADGSRRFPPPWCADKMPGGYVVRDANGQSIAFVYGRATEAEAMQARDAGEGVHHGRGAAHRHQHRAAAGAEPCVTCDK
jgi:hypothetical protein